MPLNYIPRSLETVLTQAITEFPVVVLVGPRQSGKTTLLQHLFGAERPLISLEPPDIRAAAAGDPRAFLDLNRPPMIFDEIQYAADLLPFSVILATGWQAATSSIRARPSCRWAATRWRGRWRHCEEKRKLRSGKKPERSFLFERTESLLVSYCLRHHHSPG